MNRSYSFGIFYQDAGEKYLIHNIVIPASSVSVAFKKARSIEVALNNCWNVYRVRLLDVNGTPLPPESIDFTPESELPF